VRSTALVLAGDGDLAPAASRVRPFVTACGGVGRHQIDEVGCVFPSLGSQAVTITRGGSSLDLVTARGAGVTVPLSSSFSLDAAYRWTDFGAARTDAGRRASCGRRAS